MIYAVTLPLLLLGGISLLISTEILKGEIDQSESRNVKYLAEKVEHYLREPVYDLKLIKNHLEELKDIESVFFKKTLNYILKSKKYISGIQIADSAGKIIVSVPSNKTIVGNDISGHNYFKETIRKNRTHWTPSFMSEELDTPVTSISIPMNKGIITIFLSLKDIKNIISDGQRSKEYRDIVVTDQNGVYIYHPDNTKVLLREYDPLFSLKSEEWKGLGHNKVVEVNNRKFLSYTVFINDIDWMISLYKPLEYIYKPIKYMAIFLIILTMIFTGISILFGNVLRISLTRSIRQLLEATEIIAGGHYEIFIPKIDFTELIKLSESIEKMAMDIREREGNLIQAKDKLSKHKDNLEMEVKKRTSELTESLNSLKLTQNKLIESEKMAYLGGLVAGVAHEINTPIGIIVSASSYLEEQVNKFLKDYKENKISHTIFNKFCNEALKSTKLLLTNSFRASNLIKSFKQVAVDQSSEHKRSFDIKDYLDEVLASNHSIFKSKEVNIEIDSPEKIVVDNYPGAFAQVITNFLNNSITHGFEHMDGGSIGIKVNDNNQYVQVIYTDNGKGMSKETLSRIFDPFFTTKRGKGGSGLGMHIVYNIVTQTLKGHIQCNSSIDKGVEFILDIPKKI